jgi:hypothetical protein
VDEVRMLWMGSARVSCRRRGHLAAAQSLLLQVSNVMRVAGIERCYGFDEGKGSEGDEPHERYQHETRLGGGEGSKPSRGCETLQAEPTG